MKFCLLPTALLAVLVASIPANKGPDKIRDTNLTSTHISPPYTEQAAPIRETNTAFDTGTAVKDPTVVRIAIKDKPANIGGLDSGETFDAIRLALEQLCPFEDDHENCRLARVGDDGWPHGGNELKTKLNNGAMLVFIERGHFTSDAIRRLMIRSIAMTMAAGQEYAGNCGYSSMFGRICNVPSYVGLVAIGTPNIMDVHFRWIPYEHALGNKANDEWDCDQIHWVVNDHFEPLKAGWNKELHGMEKAIFCV